MDVVFAESISSFIEEYELALTRYPISKKRALQKKQEMIDFFYKKLPSVGLYTLRSCPYIKLGQIIRNGQPQLPYLLMGSYKDKSSRTTWLFSCIIDNVTDTLTICKILHSNGVYESKSDGKITISKYDIHKMVRECVTNILAESYTTWRRGKYTIVAGDNKPHSISGLEKYGNNLYDVAMYNSLEEHICAFSIGKNTNKFICCNLEYDKDYGEWLGFTPIKSYDVPMLIRQDLRERFTNS